MNIYDELTHDLLNSDFVEAEVKAGKGRTYPGKIQVGEIPAKPESYVHIPGSETPENPGGSDRIIPGAPAQPIFEECLYYHEFTPEELAPTWQETMEAQVLYTALMTDTILEE